MLRTTTKMIETRAEKNANINFNPIPRERSDISVCSDPQPALSGTSVVHRKYDIVAESKKGTEVK